MTEELRLRVSRKEAYDILTRQIERGREVMQLPANAAQYGATDIEAKKWEDRTLTNLRQIYTGTAMADAFQPRQGSAYPDIDAQFFRERIERRVGLLEGYLESLEDIPEPAEIAPQAREPLDVVVQILRRFHIVALQLRGRKRGRTPITIGDEYDVQYLLPALLKIEFDDIRPEEHTPSYAGTQPILDFLLKKERIVIEAKMTRDGLRDKDVTKQLSEDIETYRGHPDCSTLVCFVYDPGGWIANPRGLETDLSGPRNAMTVQVIVVGG